MFAVHYLEKEEEREEEETEFWLAAAARSRLFSRWFLSAHCRAMRSSSSSLILGTRERRFRGWGTGGLSSDFLGVSFDAWGVASILVTSSDLFQRGKLRNKNQTVRVRKMKKDEGFGNFFLKNHRKRQCFETCYILKLLEAVWEIKA